MNQNHICSQERYESASHKLHQLSSFYHSPFNSPMKLQNIGEKNNIENCSNSYHNSHKTVDDFNILFGLSSKNEKQIYETNENHCNQNQSMIDDSGSNLMSHHFSFYQGQIMGRPLIAMPLTQIPQSVIQLNETGNTQFGFVSYPTNTTSPSTPQQTWNPHVVYTLSAPESSTDYNSLFTQSQILLQPATLLNNTTNMHQNEGVNLTQHTSNASQSYHLLPQASHVQHLTPVSNMPIFANNNVYVPNNINQNSNGRCPLIHQKRSNSIKNDHPNIVTLNVGGQTFTTTKSTLSNSPLFKEVFDLELRKSKNKKKLKQKIFDNQNQVEGNSCCENVNNNKSFAVNENPIDIMNNEENENNLLVYGSSQEDEDNQQSRYQSKCILKTGTASYFVDRSPKYFDDILQFLRTQKIHFEDNETEIENNPIYSNKENQNMCSTKDFSSPASFGDSNSNDDNKSSSTHQSPTFHQNRSMDYNDIPKYDRYDLQCLKDEAEFYRINKLTLLIQEKLEDGIRCATDQNSHQFSNTAHHFNLQSSVVTSLRSHKKSNSSPKSENDIPSIGKNNHQMKNDLRSCSLPSPNDTDFAQNKEDKNENGVNISWWDQDGPLRGMRHVQGTRIAFAVSRDNYCDIHPSFDIPRGYKWASQAEYLNEYEKHRMQLACNKEWIHYNLGGWKEYHWKFVMKVAFIFRDSFRCGRFVHAGMQISDISHVAQLFHHMQEGHLMECDEQRGIVEGFAGLVLLKDDKLNENT